MVAGVVARLHGLDTRQRSIVVTRIKHMQLLRFPQASPAGRGHVTRFDLEDLLKVVIAFQLIEIGMPSFRAVDLVGNRWTACLGAAALAWRFSTHGGVPAPAITLRPRATAALGVVKRDPQQALERLHVGEPPPLAAVGGSGLVVLDLGEVLKRLAAAVPLSAADLESFMIDAGNRVFGSPSWSSWRKDAIA